MDKQPKPPLLAIEGVSKRFGTLHALKNINISVAQGEVVGLAGLSGAGKSLLLTTIAGLQHPEAGSIHFYTSAKPKLTILHQKPKLVDSLDITANIFLGKEIFLPKLKNWWLLSAQAQMDSQTREILAKVGVHFETLRIPVSNLTSEERQLISMAKCLLYSTPLILVDDPMAPLSYPNQQRLLGLIQEWRAEQKGIIFSSNNLDYLFNVTDRIVVLNQGKIVADYITNTTTQEEIINHMIGVEKSDEVTPLIWAMDSYHQAKEKAEELYHSQHLLKQDLALQDHVNKKLLEQLNVQIVALNKANLALREAHQRLLTEREQERKRLARELHDEAIQDLYSLKYQLEQIGLNPKQASKIQTELDSMQSHIQQVADSLRRICADLRPPTLDSLGLEAAIKSLIEEWSGRTNIPVMLQLAKTEERLPELFELNVFRIIQEAMNNIARHSGATQARLHIEYRHPRVLILIMSDNGKGLPEDFDLAQLAKNGHYGVLGISERVALLGGKIELRNQTSGGLMLQIELPIRAY